MPFPFNRLPWGNQNRLRDLMTPSELYLMQLALGGIQNGLGPLQPCRKTENGSCLIRNEPQNGIFETGINGQNISKLVYDNVNDDDRNKNEVIIIENLFVTEDILETDSEIPRLIHPYTVLHIEYLEFHKQEIKIDASMMKQFASLCSKGNMCLMARDVQLEPDVNMPFIFTLFPNLNMLELQVDHTDTWLDDLLEIEVNWLEKLYINLPISTVKEMFKKLRVESLYKLCKAQPPDFQLYLFFDTIEDLLYHEEFEVQVWNYLKPHFRETQNGHDYLKLMMAVDEHKFNACYA